MEYANSTSCRSMLLKLSYSRTEKGIPHISPNFLIVKVPKIFLIVPLLGQLLNNAVQKKVFRIHYFCINLFVFQLLAIVKQ